jgi:SnoaL-like polyketide cyclase
MERRPQPHRQDHRRDFIAYAAAITGTGPDQIRGREAPKGWISGIHAVLPDLSFVIEVGPITDDEHLVVRWKAQGTYRGGFPGAPNEAIGRHVSFTGTDILRTADGKLAEYWANTDSLLFFQQLGIHEVPGG